MREAKIIEQMKREARDLNGRSFAWRECEHVLINCKYQNQRYQWRRVDTASGPGREIVESTALKILQSHFGWVGGN